MSDMVIFEQLDGVASLTLNRAAQRNALNLGIWTALEEHIATIREAGETIGAVVLKAKGPTFCAGNDLKERGIAMPRPNYQASIISLPGSMAGPPNRTALLSASPTGTAPGRMVLARIP